MNTALPTLRRLFSTITPEERALLNKLLQYATFDDPLDLGVDAFSIAVRLEVATREEKDAKRPDIVYEPSPDARTLLIKVAKTCVADPQELLAQWLTVRGRSPERWTIREQPSTDVHYRTFRAVTNSAQKKEDDILSLVNGMPSEEKEQLLALLRKGR